MSTYVSASCPGAAGALHRGPRLGLGQPAGDHQQERRRRVAACGQVDNPGQSHPHSSYSLLEPITCPKLETTLFICVSFAEGYTLPYRFTLFLFGGTKAQKVPVDSSIRC